MAKKNFFPDKTIKADPIPTVRGSFSLPENEYESIVEFLEKNPLRKNKIGKSELVRVGFYQAKQLEIKEILKILDALGRRIPGRPLKEPTSLSQINKPEHTSSLSSFNEITDEQWDKIKSVFTTKLESKEFSEKISIKTRNKLNAVLYVIGLGTRWNDVPRSFAAPATANRAFNQWVDLGIWQKICEQFYSTLNSSEKKVWYPLLASSLLETARLRRNRSRNNSISKRDRNLQE